MKTSLLILFTVLVFPALAQADEAALLLSGLSGRVVATGQGYQAENGYMLRTSTGYRATLRDGRIVTLTRTATGWNISQSGGSDSSARVYFHRR